MCLLNYCRGEVLNLNSMDELQGNLKHLEIVCKMMVWVCMQQTLPCLYLEKVSRIFIRFLSGLINQKNRDWGSQNFFPIPNDVCVFQKETRTWINSVIAVPCVLLPSHSPQPFRIIRILIKEDIICSCSYVCNEC